MSILHVHNHVCACGATLQVRVADSINAVRHPHLRAAVLDSTLHRYRCEVCGAESALERELCYVDFDRRQFLGVYPVADLPYANQRARQVADVFDRQVRRDAPEAIRALADQFLVRVCFGYAELREKLLCDDHRMSDLALEHLKLRVLVSDPRFRDNAIVTLWLARVDGDLLWFQPGALEAGATMPPVVVERAVYDEVAAPGDAKLYEQRPELASGPHVSLLRLVKWAPSGSEPAR